MKTSRHSCLARARTSLLAGTALAGSALCGLLPAVVPSLAVPVAAVGVAAPIFFGIGGSARAGNGGAGGSTTAATGGTGGMPGSPNGGTGGYNYNAGGGGGGGGAPGGSGGDGGGNPGSGGVAGGNGHGGPASKAGGGGAGGANPASVPTFSNTTQKNGSNGGRGGYGGGGNGTAGGGGGGAGGYGFIATGLAGVSTSSAKIYAGTGGQGGSGAGAGNGGNGGDGGIGVQFSASAVGASFTTSGVVGNSIGSVYGGRGGAGGTSARMGLGGNGGIGVQFNAIGTLNNAAGNTVGGGGGGYGVIGGTGGPGVSMQFGGTINNKGPIDGGFGANGQSIGGIGGNGIVGSGITINNNGGINGGHGGNSQGAGGIGGSGGFGIYGSNLTINNNGGSVMGGRGGDFIGAGGLSGFGGIGIYGSNLTISNTGGTIQGGLTPGANGGQEFAIQFNGGTNAVGTGGSILGGIFVFGGSFMPALPGSTIGTPLAITGSLLFEPGTSFNVRVTPTASDSVSVTAASLNGASVNVTAIGGASTTQRYTILTSAGGIFDTFSGVTSNLTFLTPKLSYDANDAFLSFTQNSFIPAAITQNQRAVAAGLDAGARANNAAGPIIAALDQLNLSQARTVLDSLSGEGIIAAQNAAHRSVSEFTSSIFDQTTFYGGGSTANSITLTAPIRELADLPSHAVAPVAPLPLPRTWRAWTTGFGGAEYIGGQAGVGSASEHNAIYGGTLGVDYQITPSYLAGIAVGGSDGAFNVNGRSTSGSTTGGHIAFYDLATFGAFYGASTNSVSFFTNKTTRNVASFGGLAGETDRGTFDSHEFRTRAEFGRHFGASDLSGYGLGGVFTPFIALEIAELRSNGFNETNLAGPTVLGLNVQGQSAASVPSFVGARYQGKTSLGDGMVLSPSLQLAYVHEFAPQRTQVGALINLPGSTFLVNGAQPASNAAQVKAGAELAIGPQSTLFVTFDGEFSGQAQFYGGKGGFKYVW